MEQEDLHLYVDAQFASPYALSAYVALIEKGLSLHGDAVPAELAYAHRQRQRSSVQQWVCQSRPPL